MNAKPFVIRATHTATCAHYYLTGFETVRRGYSRAVPTTAHKNAKRYSANTSARALDKWAGDTYAKTAFTGFEIVAAECAA